MKLDFCTATRNLTCLFREENRYQAFYSLVSHKYFSLLAPTDNERCLEEGASESLDELINQIYDLNTRTRSWMLLVSRAPSAYTSLLRGQSRSRINLERIFPYRTTKNI